ncbi:hypothetical protein Tco_0974966 [Tanacetum coccineum]|uniref:Reverse transcriptase domain-containing protein n=1 Tax=Tanacetum coccineum TaxID=301880 RepID=A0ABQ5ED15_9ASTR
MIQAVRINVPLVDVLARMPNCGKFLKELISNKHKIKQISVAFLSDESSAILQSKVPPKLRDLGSFLIPCNFNKAFSCNALSDLDTSINLMPYSLYAKLSLETLKPTKMSQTATYGKVKYCEDEDDCFKNFETEFPAIVFDDTLTSNATLSCKPTVSPFNENEINFRISFDESDDEDYMVIFDNNSVSYKIIYVDNLKTNSENDKDKVDMPLFLSLEPTVSYSNDLDYFKDFETEFPAIVYNDSLTSKLDSLTEPAVSHHNIDKLDLKNETSLSECDEEE